MYIYIFIYIYMYILVNKLKYKPEDKLTRSIFSLC